MKLDGLYYRLKSLTLFRPLLDEPVMSAALSLLQALVRQDGEAALDDWSALAERLNAAGTASLAQWLDDTLKYAETSWARAVELGRELPSSEAAARRDTETLSALAGLDPAALRDTLAALLPDAGREAAGSLPLWESGEILSFEELRGWYQEHGTGLFARCRAFLWEAGRLLPVPHPDIPGPEALVGYRQQRSQVEANTYALLSGKQVNNVLLYGNSGTGKSATVKSLLSLPGAEELRLIEIEKSGVAQMPQLMRMLGGRRQKFILFIDDLAFDQDDLTYGVLKTILEGGLEPRPANVAIYATSNRRHLVRQNFSDRGSDEVDAAETISEKTALAERFGLRIPYLTMNKSGYLALVDHLAGQAGITMDREVLHAQAMTWEIRHSGRTPRVARQFIASLLQ